MKPHLQQTFQTYAGTADMYVFFVELGMRLLNEKGEFTYILPNKWMRAGYGKGLREWVKKYQMKEIIDFGDLQVFEEATTYPCIWSMEKTEEENKIFRACEVKTLDFEESLAGYVKQNAFPVNVGLLNDDGWTLVNSKVQALLQKIKGVGIPLGDYVEGKIYRGVLTGLNEAFVIDEATKDRLIAEDSNSVEVIKPFLGGRDIKRYQQPVADKYLILFKAGDTVKFVGKLEEEMAFAKMSERFPAIFGFLKQFEKAAKKRGDKGQYWWELRACVYYEEFELPKIFYQVFQVKPVFAFDSNQHYSNNSIWMVRKDDKVLLSILNSKIGWFLISTYCTAIQNGFQLIWKYLENIPIPNKAFDEQSSIEQMVSIVLSAKAQNPTADTSALEAEIDMLVYQMYGLTEEEIQLVEESVR